MCVEDRRKNLLLFVDHLIDVHDGWIQSDFDSLPQSFEEAADGLVDIFGTGLIPAECRELAERVAEFGEQWEAWKSGPAAAGEACPRSNGFWAALEAVRDARATAEPAQPPPSLESVSVLEKQSVPDGQICAIYGWGTINRPDLKKLAEERAKPGTHTGPGFLPPIQKAWHDQRESDKQKVAEIKQLRAAKVAPPKAGESLEDLLEQGVSAQQIGTMMGKTTEEVFGECDRRGLPRPEENYADPHTVRAPHEPEILPEVERALPGGQDVGPTIEQEIIGLHEAGKNSREIAELLSTPEEAVSWQKAAGVVRHYKAHPESFAAPSEG